MSPRITSRLDLGTLDEIISRYGEQRAEATYLIGGRSRERLSYGDLARRVRELGMAFDRVGIAMGERVGLLVTDPVTFAVYFLALIAHGIWVAPLDPYVTATSVEQFSERARAMRLDKVIGDRAALSRDLVWVETSSLEIAPPVPTPRASTWSKVHAARSGVILASSGTTGTPKVMLLSEEQLLVVACLVATHNELDDAERGFNALPLWHINAEVVGLLATLAAGASLVLDDRFHRTDFWALIEEFEVTWINAVPAIISRLSTLAPEEHVPNQVRFIRSASAPLSATLLTRFEDLTGIRVVESYGMTEAASQICVGALYGAHRPGSVGRPVGVDLRVVRDTDEGPVAELPHEIGHVEIRGASVIDHYDAKGYEGRFSRGGWLRTGDLGYLDAEGYVYLVGRSDDVINRGGEKIFPREIEELVTGVYEVHSAAVVASSDEVFGQVPTLYVQLKDVTASSAPAEIAVALKGVRDVLVASLARTRRPTQVRVVATMPTHATGKIQKKHLDTSHQVLYVEDLV